MKMKLLLIGLLVMLFGITITAAAQDGVGASGGSSGTTAATATPTDDEPVESPEDNACYTGGSLEGKCDWPTDEEDEWAWECGWYIARVDTGEFAVTDVPEWCNYFVNVEEVSPTCYTTDGGMSPDFQLTGPLNSLNNATGFNSNDGSCSGLIPESLGTVVTAPAGEDGLDEASATCTELYGEPVLAVPLDLAYGYVNTPSTWWACQSVMTTSV